jgi:phosphatidylglycerol---prolipoprotein diacylglyceryl transferase
MLQELFRIPILNMPVYGYGVMLVLGFFCAVALMRFLAQRSGLDGEVFVNAALIALVTGIIGARLSHVLENLEDFTRPELGLFGNLKNVVNMRSGGLTYYGGFLLATPCTILYGVMKKVPLRLGMDIVAPALMIGLGFGRVGCFLNGCCHGTECELPWAVRFPYYSNAYLDQADGGQIMVPPELQADTVGGNPRPVPWGEVHKRGPVAERIAHAQRSLPVHPAQLYSTITAWMLAAMLVAYFTLPHVPGRVFALMLMLEGATRFLLELLRTEPSVAGRMSLSMIIGLGLVATGAVLWFAFGRYGRGGTIASAPGATVHAAA